MDRARGARAAAGGSEALVATLTNAVQALGRGFDVTSDARLLYCKGAPGSRLVVLDDASSRSLVIADGDCAGGEIVLPDVPLDIAITMESDRREPSGVCTFQQDACPPHGALNRMNTKDLKRHIDVFWHIYRAV